MTEKILGYQVVSAGPAEVANEMVRWILDGGGCQTFARINPHTYGGALAGPRVSAALAGAGWLVPDGVGVVLASRLLGGQIWDRVTGHPVFSGVLEKLDRSGPFRTFFFGSTPATLAAIQERMARDYPRLVVAGVLPDLQVKFAGAVGAVFDFYIGRIRRSGPIFLEHGLEWLPRLLQEPRRL